MKTKSPKSPLFLAIIAALLVSQAFAEDPPIEPQTSKHSPTGALLRSAVFPGWGQLYNKKYIKAAVIGIGESILIYQTAWHWDRTSEYRKLYLSDTGIVRTNHYYQFDRYRDLRNQYIWFLGLTIFYSMFDAYVDAHLRNFDVDLTPDFNDEANNLTLWLRLSFKY